MKKYIFNGSASLLILLTMIVSISCQEMDVDTQNPYSPSFSVSAMETYSVPSANAQQVVFNVSSNTPWTVQSDKEWCLVSPGTSGASSLIEDITLSFSDNILFEDRVANVIISAEGTDQEVVIAVTQLAKGELYVQPIDDPMSKDAGSSQFTVESNKPWGIRSEKQWLTFDKSSGEANDAPETIVASATVNNGTRRSTLVTVTNADNEEYQFTVIQNGFTLEFVEIEDTAKLAYSNAGESKVFEVKSDIVWKAECDMPGVTLTKLSETELEITLAKTIYLTKRTMDVRLVPAEADSAGEPNFISITQPAIITYGDWNSDQTYEHLEYNYDEGSITMHQAPDHSVRLDLVEHYKYGTLKWTVSNVNIDITESAFQLMSYVPGSWGNYNCRTIIGYNSDSLKDMIISGGSTPGGIGMWDYETYLSYTQEQMDEMHTLEISMLPGAEDGKYLRMEVKMNGVQIGLRTGMYNPWKDPDAAGFWYWFGFQGWGEGHSITFNTFEFIPYVE